MQNVFQKKQLSKLFIQILDTTIYRYFDKDFSAKQFCDELKWKYRDWADMHGCEDEAVIVLDCLTTEPISRPHKLLVMVTTAGVR